MTEGRVGDLRRRARELREIAATASASHGAPVPVTAARIVALRAAGGFMAREALHRGLLDPALPLRRTLREHASKRRLLPVQLRLNPPGMLGLTEDKEQFARAAAQRGLPAARLVAVIDGPGEGRAADGGPLGGAEGWRRALEREPGEAIVIKPALGFLGRGVRVLRRDGDDLVDVRGGRASPAELYAELARSGRVWLAQERLVDHPGLQGLNASTALQTVRFTMLLGDGGDPVLFSWLKLAPATATIDNYAGGRTGTVYADVDPASGVIAGLWAPRPGGVGSVRVDRHPVTGAALTGATVPLWDEARALALRASEAFLPMRSIGWDIALTPDGPALIEGNARWDPPPVGAISGALLRRLVAA